MTEQMIHRELTGRITRADTADDRREVVGIGVPYGVEIELWDGSREQFAPGSVDSTGALLLWRHDEPIGTISDGRDIDQGHEVTGRVSATPRGDEALTLVDDGVIRSYSIGFMPSECTREISDDGLTTWTQVRAREFSLVPFPAYSDAVVTGRRDHTSTQPSSPDPEEPHMTTDTVTRDDHNALTESLDDLHRELRAELAQLRTQLTDSTPAPSSQFRTAGEIVRAAIAPRDGQSAEAAVAELNEVAARAFAGTTVGDAPPSPTWVRDLTRIVEERSGLAQWFSTDVLPATGMTVDYAQTKTNTLQVSEQAAEGDTLAFGKFEAEPQSAPVKTYGGYTTLSRQAVERTSTVNLLDRSFQGMAVAAGNQKKVAFRTFYDAQIAAQKTANNQIDLPTSPTWKDYLKALSAGLIKYDTYGYGIDAMIVDPTTFDSFIDMTGNDGRPMMDFDGSGDNTVGSLDLSKTPLRGRLAALPILVNVGQSVAGAAFVNFEALRSYNSPLARLQDGDVTNLTNAYSVYHYSALAAEIPHLIVPLVKAA